MDIHCELRTTAHENRELRLAPARKASLFFFLMVELKNIADMHIFETFEHHATFEARQDFTRIFREALERCNAAIEDGRKAILQSANALKRLLNA